MKEAELKDAIRTYRKIWERLPQDQRDQMLSAMREWSPHDYNVMMAEKERQERTARMYSGGCLCLH